MPELTGLDAPTFAENVVNAAPQIIDGDVTVTGADFNGGVLTLTGLLAEDRVSIQTGGAITFNAANGEVRYNGVLIGVAAGGVGTTFTVTFNAAATAASVEALIEHLTYANVSHTPTTTRDLRLHLTDGAGDPTLGALQFTERHGVASVVDRSPDLAGNPASFLVYADAADPSHQNHYIYAQRSSETYFYFVRFGADARIDLFASSMDLGGSDYLNVFNVQDDFRGNFALGDLDADGDADIVAVVAGGSVGFWRNSDGPIEAVAGGGPFAGISTGGGSANVSLVDLDGDGDLDFVLGTYPGGLAYFENTGTAQAAAFTARTGGDNPLAAIAASHGPQTFADVDGDGDLDLITGSWDQGLLYYENTGTAAAAVFTQRTGAQNPFAGMDVSSWAHPLLADFDFDGDLDLIIYRPAVGLIYYENSLVGQALPVTVTPEADPNTATDGDDILTGSLAPDTLDGGDGDDIIDGGEGDDQLTGGDGDDILDGGEGDDLLTGGAGDDYLWGGPGADAMSAGLGNDTFVVDNDGDTTEDSGGVDLVRSSVDWAVSSGIENLTLNNGAGAINGSGNGLANVITGNSAANILLGLGGADTLVGAGGDDTLGGGSGADTLIGGGGDDVLNGGDDDDGLDGGTGDDQLFGGAGADDLIGGAGHDLLDGGTGGDDMVGGLGNDTYVVDNVLDTVTEAVNGGTDTVQAQVSHALGANVEHLTLTGAGDIDGTGNGLRNTIVGNSGANSLSGGGEIDMIHGMDGDDTLYGEAGNDVLDGGAGRDAVHGGVGNDRLTGGAGGDLFMFTDLEIRRSTLAERAYIDTITDIDFAGGDIIDLSAIDANVNTVGVDDAFVFVSRFTRTAGEATLSSNGARTTVRFDVDGDGKADLIINLNGDQRASSTDVNATAVDGGWYL